MNQNLFKTKELTFAFRLIEITKIHKRLVQTVKKTTYRFEKVLDYIKSKWKERQEKYHQN